MARMGGEEFAVLLKGASLKEAVPIAERIARGGRFTVSPNEDEISVTTSVGVAERRGNVSIDSILHSADQALYRAKADGRACFRIAGDAVEPDGKAVAVA